MAVAKRERVPLSSNQTPTMAELSLLCDELDEEIASAAPVCRASGRCCRFREYGHTLFLTRLEAERLLEQGLPPGSEISDAGCPYQIGGLCTARERRPTACRIYFCDPTFQERQQDLSEGYIQRLKNLHDRHGLPWEYRPLQFFLDEISPAMEAKPSGAGLPVLGELP